MEFPRPGPGQQIQCAYLSHVAVDEHCSDVLIDLIDVARDDTVGSGIDYLIIGMASENPLLGSVCRAFRGREYRSLLYLVHYPSAEPAVDALAAASPSQTIAVVGVLQAGSVVP